MLGVEANSNEDSVVIVLSANGLASRVYMKLVHREAVVGDKLHCLPGGNRIYGNGLLIYMIPPQHQVAKP